MASSLAVTHFLHVSPASTHSGHALSARCWVHGQSLWSQRPCEASAVLDGRWPSHLPYEQMGWLQHMHFVDSSEVLVHAFFDSF